MIRIIPCIDPLTAEDLLGRKSDQAANVDEIVATILDTVRCKGDQALFAYESQFDHVELTMLKVEQQEIDQALADTPAKFLEILQEAKRNITVFHEQQIRRGFIIDRPGVVLGQRVTPLDRVGIYVPGGTASYPSTVLMNAIPAKIAGVGEMIMVTPPSADGSIRSDILVAAHIAGVDQIFKLGGAQAIAALSYGTETVPKVDKIVGPGNIFVATAKRMVYGTVDIDMIAGPSEILVIADESASAAHIAADLLSQAEHDVLASAILVTTSQQFAELVSQEIDKQLTKLPRREIATKAIDHYSAIFVTDTLENAIAISNQIAPEHLELCLDEPFAYLPLVKHAGSIFLGKYAPEALGDYFAGPNHTLPTSGTARFSSPLSVDDFCKKSSFIYYDRAALEASSRQIATFARREGLEGHARSVMIRFEEERE